MNFECVLKGHDYIIVDHLLHPDGKPIRENVNAKICRRCGDGMAKMLSETAELQGITGKVTKVKWEKGK